MGHDHGHDHGSQTSYYVEQIVTIAACGAIAGVCILLYVNGTSLNSMLKSDQHLRVLFGGIGLLILVLIRAAYVWIAAGKTSAKVAEHNHSHDHDHAHCDHKHEHDHAHCDHDHKHDHDHAHCDHDHDHKHEPALAASGHDHSHADHGHDHSHGLVPWRFALLLLPVVLFLLGLPAAGGMIALNQKDDSGSVKDVGNAAGKGSNFTIGFNTLELARNPEIRESIAGSTIQLKGMYSGEHPERFTLIRFKINCCAADAIALKAIIMIDPAKTGKFKVDPVKYNRKWVQVTGQLQFSKIKNDIVPVIVLSPESQSELETEMIKEIPPDNNPYAND